MTDHAAIRGVWRARCRVDWHAGFGRRAGETHRWKHQQGAPVRPHLILGERHLAAVLRRYTSHYNHHRVRHEVQLDRAEVRGLRQRPVVAGRLKWEAA
jgi:hypothetical protein